MTDIITTTKPANSPLQIHAFTGSQLKSALEKHYKTIAGRIHKFKLHNQKLSSHILIKNTAYNVVTFGEYGKLYTLQKSLTNNPVEQEKTRQLIRNIETKYTTPPHIIELSKEIKILESNFAFLIKCNNNTIAELMPKAAATLEEKRKITGRETETFKSLSNKIVDLPNDALYQSHFVAKPTQPRGI